MLIATYTCNIIIMTVSQSSCLPSMGFATTVTTVKLKSSTSIDITPVPILKRSITHRRVPINLGPFWSKKVTCILKYDVFPDIHLLYSVLLIVTPFVICGVHSRCSDPIPSAPSPSIRNIIPSITKLSPGSMKVKFKLIDVALGSKIVSKEIFPDKECDVNGS